MAEYRLRASAFQAVMRRQLLRQVPFALAAIIIGLFVAFQGVPRIDLQRHLPILLLLCGAVGVGMLRGVARTKKHWASYCLSVADDGTFSRAIQGMPTVTLSPGEIARVEENPGRGLKLLSGDARKCIFVPAGLADYGEFRNSVAAIRPIETTHARFGGVLW